MCAAPPAAIAHSDAWFADELAGALGAACVHVIGRTHSGADALGAIVAEQPDDVVTGDRLLLMSGAELLRETRLFAAGSLRTFHDSSEQQLEPRPGRGLHAPSAALRGRGRPRHPGLRPTRRSRPRSGAAARMTPGSRS
jgi:hypothetical protein